MIKLLAILGLAFLAWRLVFKGLFGAAQSAANQQQRPQGPQQNSKQKKPFDDVEDIDFEEVK